MTLADIQALPVADVAAPACLLALWCPAPLLPDGLATLAVWGFTYKQLWVWLKTTKDGRKRRTLTGHYARSSKEPLLIGVRGRVVPLLQARNELDTFDAPIGPHSAKPEVLQDKLERMLDGPYLELFARRVRPGWTCRGNECPASAGEDIRASLASLITA